MCLSWPVAAAAAFIVMATHLMLALVLILDFPAMPVAAQRQVHILLPIRQRKVQQEVTAHSDKVEVKPVDIILGLVLPVAAEAGMAEAAVPIMITTAQKSSTVTVAAQVISSQP